MDEHPLILEGCRHTLLNMQPATYELMIDTAANADIAYEKIRRLTSGRHYDLIFLDVHITATINGERLCGEGLALKLKDLLPDTKLVFLTSLHDSFSIYRILKSVSPDGYLVKQDTTPAELVRAFHAVQLSPPYYSSSVSKLIRSRFSIYEDIDEQDRLILYYLSQGFKTKDLTRHVHLSLPAIEKRKKRLKVLLDPEQGDNQSLLKEARKHGII